MSQSDKEQEAKYRNVSENIHDVTRRVFVSNPRDTSEQEQGDFFFLFFLQSFWINKA